MKHILRYSNYTASERLDDILDKISKYGMNSLSKLEREFLEAHKSGKEQELHDKLSKSEVETSFEDDYGYFKFDLIDIQEYKDIDGSSERHFIGTLYVPDLEWPNGKKIEGRLEGKIIKYSNGVISLEFTNDDYDVFEFCNGLEYELDSFTDYVVSEIEEKYKFKK
jgi:hypothetical protein